MEELREPREVRVREAVVEPREVLGARGLGEPGRGRGLRGELAQVRFRQQNYGQAESLAVRSNTLAGSDAELRAMNQRLIDDARAAKR